MFCVESNPPGFGFQTLVNCVVGGLLIRVIFILFIPSLICLRDWSRYRCCYVRWYGAQAGLVPFSV